MKCKAVFDLDNRYTQLSKLNDPLIELSRVIDWELFRAPLAKLAGRKPIDRVLLFKMLVLQRLYNLADEALEYQVRDRLSFICIRTIGRARARVQIGLLNLAYNLKRVAVLSVGDSYDNALAETINGLYKTEVIRKRGHWRNIDAVEYATLEWVDWFNAGAYRQRPACGV